VQFKKIFEFATQVKTKKYRTEFLIEDQNIFSNLPTELTLCALSQADFF
jgi:hypothetical protein